MFFLIWRVKEIFSTRLFDKKINYIVLCTNGGKLLDLYTDIAFHFIITLFDLPTNVCQCYASAFLNIIFHASIIFINRFLVTKKNSTVLC